MKRLSVTSILVIIAGLAFLGNPHPDIFNQNPNPEGENLENVIRSYQVASGKKTFNHPTSIYPVYLKMLHDISASERQRDILKFTIANTKPPPDPILPPTGDVTEEEYDEEEDEEDDVQSDKESKENDKESKENDESSEEEDNQSDQRTSKETSKEITKVEEKAEPHKVSSVPLPPQKGDTGSTEVNDDKSAKKRSKKKKKKKKKAKKAHLHFAPAPLGPKADLIFRLDKVHKNVREIFSVFKGVLTDYVVKRPHVNIEFYNKGEIPPFPKGWNKEEKGKDRSDFSSYALDSRSQQAPPWNPSKWRKKYPKNEKPDEISKRFGLEDCADDDEKCDEQPSVSEVDEKPGSNSKPQTLVRLPYPIYMESGDDEEYSPFDDLPPLSSSYFKPEEKTWVKTWDKKKTGLPKIADSKEASKRVKHKNIRDY